MLRTLARLQRTLDALDVEGLGALWARLRGVPDAIPDHALDLSERAPTPPPLGKGEAEPDVAEWGRFVDAYLARYGAEGTGEGEGEGQGETEEELERERAVREGDEDELRFRLLAYLLSASFKDCSLILRARPVAVDAAKDTSTVPVTVTVIDLDVKGIDRLAKWAKLDAEIVAAYTGSVAEPRNCRDGGA